MDSGENEQTFEFRKPGIGAKPNWDYANSCARTFVSSCNPTPNITIDELNWELRPVRG